MRILVSLKKEILQKYDFVLIPGIRYGSASDCLQQLPMIVLKQRCALTELKIALFCDCVTFEILGTVQGI